MHCRDRHSPTRAETGYGYIEAGNLASGVLQVRRFTEKPNLVRAEEFVNAGNFFWNSGMFVWGARTLANALREHLPKTAPLEKIAAATARASSRTPSAGSIPSARTSASTTRCSSHVPPRASRRPISMHSGQLRLERSGLVDGAL